MEYRASGIGAGGGIRLIFLLALLGLAPAYGQGPNPGPAAENFGPRIGIIDFYGLREVSEEVVRRELGVTEGDFLPRSKNETELRIERIKGVVRAQLQAVCCHDGKAILYVGIEEEGAPHYGYRYPPEDPVRLPQVIHDTYVGFLASLNVAVRDQDIEEDLTQGHALMSNPATRRFQEKFVELAAEHLDVIRNTLRNSVDSEHRAIAAYVIGYAPDKREVVDDLMYALRDPDDTVRSNAMRALSAIEVLAKRKPTLDIKIPPTWLIEMLNSVIWTDRHSAAVNLVHLTEDRNPGVLAQIRERALDSLLDMARWEHLPHALPAYILIGRILGVDEQEIQSAWESQERLALLDKVAEPEQQ